MANFARSAGPGSPFHIRLTRLSNLEHLKLGRLTDHPPCCHATASELAFSRVLTWSVWSGKDPVIALPRAWT